MGVEEAKAEEGKGEIVEDEMLLRVQSE